MTERPHSLESISAFIDNEPFDAHELGEALSTAEGRELLLDLVALGDVVSDDAGAETVRTRPKPRVVWRSLAAAAAIVVAVSGGYAVGLHRASGGSDAGSNTAAPLGVTTGASSLPTSFSATAPAPTRVIDIPAWQTRNGGF